MTAGIGHDDWDVAAVAHRLRVISDNDYGGDPDGLVQLAHLLLSPNVDTRCVIASHLGANDPFDLASEGTSTDRGAAEATTVAEMCASGDVPVVLGHEGGLVDRTTPHDSAGARAIVAEAMRDDTHLPLYVTVGGSLTEIASAWLLEPRIADRLTLVWIGGHEYPHLADPPPGGSDMEYNTGLDPIAAQVVFNDSNLDIWQVPRSTYRMAIATRSELRRRMRPAGALGRHLFGSLGGVARMAGSHGSHVGETYVLGDSPLVLLTALWTSFEPGPASSPSAVRPCPLIEDSGLYTDRPDGRPIRIFTGVDNRLMFEDLYAKLDELADGERPVPTRS